jgi:hypothetical protein
LKTRKINGKNLGNLEFDEIWPTSYLLYLVSKKNMFQVKMGQVFEFLFKGEFGLILR